MYRKFRPCFLDLGMNGPRRRAEQRRNQIFEIRIRINSGAAAVVEQD